MQKITSVELVRDCPAVQIPAGNAVSLPAGTAVDITQTLGGTYTVHAMGGLYRIGGEDADALGLQPEGDLKSEPREAVPVRAEELEMMVWDTLKSCYDPEIPVNIVDLGLIYDMQIKDRPEGGRHVGVKMTLTAPGCGMGSVIAGDAQQKLLLLPGVGSADVEIVWDPPWHQSMITVAGRTVLGLE
jgi:probable FeS assembly SUF system protein SufT